jgi:hypothetical protein
MPRNEDVAVCCSGHLPSWHLVILKLFRGVHWDTQRWASDAAKGRCCGVLLSGHLPSCHLVMLKPFRGVHRDRQRWASDAAE